MAKSKDAKELGAELDKATREANRERYKAELKRMRGAVEVADEELVLAAEKCAEKELELAELEEMSADEWCEANPPTPICYWIRPMQSEIYLESKGDYTYWGDGPAKLYWNSC